jgi:hypothetical protein
MQIVQRTSSRTLKLGRLNELTKKEVKVVRLLFLL